MPRLFYASDARHATPTLPRPTSSSSISNNFSLRRHTIFCPLPASFSIGVRSFFLRYTIHHPLSSAPRAFRRACARDLAEKAPLPLPNHGAIISESISPAAGLSVSRAIISRPDDDRSIGRRLASPRPSNWMERSSAPFLHPYDARYPSRNPGCKGGNIARLYPGLESR